MGVNLYKPVLLFWLCVFSLTACNKEKTATNTTYEALGVVKAISASSTHINIDHEEIEGFMDAMQMFFPVTDTAIVAGLAPADSVRFTIEVEGGNYAISSIEKIDR